MVDRGLMARLDAARVSFCLVGDHALALHGCGMRDGAIELLTVDEAVLRPLFWPEATQPDAVMGEPGDPVRGRVRWAAVPGHTLLVGSGHAMVFAVDTARAHPAAGCRVATPLGLVLLILARGGPGSRADVVELIRAQEAWRGGRWRPAVEEHLYGLPDAACASWEHVLRDLSVP